MKQWSELLGAFILGALVGGGVGMVFSAMAWREVVEQYRLEARESNRARELALEQLQELAWPPVPMDNPRRRRPKQ